MRSRNAFGPKANPSDNLVSVFINENPSGRSGINLALSELRINNFYDPKHHLVSQINEISFRNLNPSSSKLNYLESTNRAESESWWKLFVIIKRLWKFYDIFIMLLFRPLFSGGWLDKLPRRSSGNLISFQERREVSTSRWHLSAAGLNRHGRESACVSAVWRENVSNFPVSRHVVTHHEKRRYVVELLLRTHASSRISFEFSSQNILFIFNFPANRILRSMKYFFIAKFRFSPNDWKEEISPNV